MKASAAVLLTISVYVSLCTPVYAADALAAKGAKATLSVEYSYESKGSNKNKYDLHEWRVLRVATLSSTLTAQLAQPLPSMQPLEAAQEAGLARKQDLAASAQNKMAPMMADIEKFMAKCGDDEACMEREIQNYGMNTKTTADALSAKGDVQAISKQNAPRYQVWSGSQQSGTYSIDETVHRLDADPICMEKPNKRCTFDMTRKGAGAIPAPPSAKKDRQAATGFASVEVDSVKNTMMVALPSPIMPLPYSQTIVTNKPGEKSGTTQQAFSFASARSQPIMIQIKGEMRRQAGEQTIKVKGDTGEGGTLKVRWQFSAQ